MRIMRKEYNNPIVDCIELQGEHLMEHIASSPGSQGDGRAPERGYRPKNFGL